MEQQLTVGWAYPVIPTNLQPRLMHGINSNAKKLEDIEKRLETIEKLLLEIQQSLAKAGGTEKDESQN